MDDDISTLRAVMDLHISLRKGADEAYRAAHNYRKRALADGLSQRIRNQHAKSADDAYARATGRAEDAALTLAQAIELAGQALAERKARISATDDPHVISAELAEIRAIYAAVPGLERTLDSGRLARCQCAE